MPSFMDSTSPAPERLPGYARFQIAHAERPLLNVGCGANICRFEGPGVVHLDLDRWHYRRFVQADAHHLPFRDDVFAAVACGDVLEHLVDPLQSLREMRRVARRAIITVFLEWRLGGPGQHIAEGRALYEPMESHYAPFLRSGQCLARYSEYACSHSPHIWQFSPEMLLSLFSEAGWSVLLSERDCPGIHEGHSMTNLLYVLERRSP